ncbi:SKP1-like protein 1B [Miscanthus floridulus]|uniref:SKP1-like protein 1B n=1 Tax=Miscanthus floridulus TaxID=154761 RepID=UPI00345A78C6
MTVNKTPAQVRTMFNIANDFTAEEKEEIRKESPGSSMTKRPLMTRRSQKEAAERLSKFLKEKIARGSTDGGIQLEKIGSEALEKVVDYFNKHADSDPSGISFVDTAASEDLKEWDRKLVDGLRMGAFFDLVQAADYLGMAGLVDVTCHKLADMMKGKTPVQIREMFNIKNDYTPEQEKEVCLENAWAFDDEDEE